MNTYWTEITYIYLFIHTSFKQMNVKCYLSIKYDHQAFEEHLFADLSILIIVHHMFYPQ